MIDFSQQKLQWTRSDFLAMGSKKILKKSWKWLQCFFMVFISTCSILVKLTNIRLQSIKTLILEGHKYLALKNVTFYFYNKSPGASNLEKSVRTSSISLVAKGRGLKETTLGCFTCWTTPPLSHFPNPRYNKSFEIKLIKIIVFKMTR